MDNTNYVRDNFKSILKSGCIGDFTSEYKKSDKHNQKKNKMVRRDKKGNGDYGFFMPDEEDNKLKVYE
jgi:hypothetical protein